MIRAFTAALGSRFVRGASRIKQMVLGGGTELQAVPTCSTKPAPEPMLSSPLVRRSYIMGSAFYFFKRSTLNTITGYVEDPFYELKMHIIASTICEPTVITAKQIVNNAGLDLKNFPLVKEHDVLDWINNYASVLYAMDLSDCYYQLLISLVIGDYIELSTDPGKLNEVLVLQNLFPNLMTSGWEEAVMTYVDLCNEYHPSSSEVSKNELLNKLEWDRHHEMKHLHLGGVARLLNLLPGRKVRVIGARKIFE